MEQTLFLLLINLFASSKRTSVSWSSQYHHPLLFLAFLNLLCAEEKKNCRKSTNDIYFKHNNLYPPNWLYPLILVLSLATIIATSNWNYLILFSPRKSQIPRNNYSNSLINNYISKLSKDRLHDERKRTCIYPTKHAKHFINQVKFFCRRVKDANYIVIGTWRRTNADLAPS